MAATSMDLRVRIVEAYENGEGSTREIGERFGVAASSVCKLYWQKHETGSLEPLTASNGRKRKITEEGEKKLRRHLEQNPDATLEELKDVLRVDCAINTVSLALKRMGLSNKKNERA